jgi:hypothetical protein
MTRMVAMDTVSAMPSAAYADDAPLSAAAQLDRVLNDANYLLRYAVEAGIEIDPANAARIVAATRRAATVWDSPEAGELLAAITKLAESLHPVTAETLRACREEAVDAIRSYKRVTYWLAGFIIPLSMIAFIIAGISNSITAELKTANELTVTLHLELNAPTSASQDQHVPSGAVAELQQFAAGMRAVYSRTRQLDWFVVNSVDDQLACKARPAGAEPDRVPGAVEKRAACGYAMMELDPDLKANSLIAVRTQVNEMTRTYQDVRLFATNVQDYTSVIWGAVGYCILPVLYGLLGACAAVLRAFTQQLEARTFAPTYATPARFIIAAIGGGVVGLFNNFSIGQGISLSPLAAAFLVGYAADIFFSFLEGSMQNLGKVKAR